MLKKTITYVNFNEETVTEEVYFHMSKPETIVLAANGWHEKLSKIIADDDPTAILQTFKSLILDAYGKKSDDGRTFMKSKEIRDEFEKSLAFEEVYAELATDTGAGVAFINAVIPKVGNAKN